MKAFMSKSWALAGIALAAVMSFAPPACAYSPTGSMTAGSGLVEFAFPSTSLKCIASLAINVTPGGLARVTGVTFWNGDIHCSLTRANGLPWTIDPATLVSPGVYDATIIDVNLKITAISGAHVATCAGNLPIRIDQNFTPHRLTFSGNLPTIAPIVGYSCIFRTQLGGAYLPTVLTAP